MKNKRRMHQQEQKGDRRGGDRSERRGRKGNLSLVQNEEEYRPRAPKRPNNTPIEPKTEVQRKYIDSIMQRVVTFGEGKAGTGKTWVAVALACRGLQFGQIDKIILTRPAVSVDEKWSAVPGSIEDKYAPYLDPYMDVLEERLGSGGLQMALKEKRVIARPLGLMRGITFKNCLVILDEAQNTTPKQMKMFLTRIGENCTVVINGDMTQQDIPGKNGLYDAVGRLHHSPNFGLVRFKSKDVVRHTIVQEIVDAYEQPAILTNPLDD